MCSAKIKVPELISNVSKIRLLLALVTAIFLAFVIGIPSARAHSALVKADPPISGVIAPGKTPAKLKLWFNEQPDVTYSRIEITGPNGLAASNGPVEIDPTDPTALLVPVRPNLSEGVYNVNWKVISTIDRHLTRGEYSFGIGPTGSSTQLGLVKASGLVSLQPGSDASNLSIWSVFSRWLNYLSGAMLVGCSIFAVLIWVSFSLNLSSVGYIETSVITRASRLGWQRLKWLAGLALILLAAGWIVALIVQFVSEAGISPFDLPVNTGPLFDFLVKTRFGEIWLARLVLILFAGLIYYFCSKLTRREYINYQAGFEKSPPLNNAAAAAADTRQAYPKMDQISPETEIRNPKSGTILASDPPPAGLMPSELNSSWEDRLNFSLQQKNFVAWGSMAGVGIFILLTTSLNSHAASTAVGSALFAITIDWIHLLATSIWVGGIISLVFILASVFSVARPGTGNRTRLVAKILPPFSRLALTSIIGLVVTGLVASLRGINSVSALLTTWYGQALLIKVTLFAFTLLIGGGIFLVIKPRLLAFTRQDKGGNGNGNCNGNGIGIGNVKKNPASRNAGRLLFQTRQVVTVEAILLVLVLVSVSVLTSLSPPSITNVATNPALTAQATPDAAHSDSQLSGITGEFKLELVVSPAEVGPNNFMLYVADARSNQPVSDLDLAQIQFMRTGPDSGQRFELTLDNVSNLVPGFYQATSELIKESGQWQATVLLKRNTQPDVTYIFKVMVSN